MWFKTLPGYKKAKAADYLPILRHCLPFLFEGLEPKGAFAAIAAFGAVLADIFEASCDIEDDAATTQENVERLQALKMRHIEAICVLEREIPESEFSIYLHESVHLCDLIYRWNSVRNWWCFLTERFVGFVKKFVHNRFLAIQSLVSSVPFFYVYFAYLIYN